MSRQMDDCLDGWMNGWKGRWMNQWMDETIYEEGCIAYKLNELYGLLQAPEVS